MDERGLNRAERERPEPQFSDVEDRVERAREVQRQLAAEIDAFMANPRVKTRTTLDPESGVADLLMVAAPAPRRWSLLASDTAHQLRSALDNLLFLLADGASMAEPEQMDLMFPILLDPDKFPGRARTLRRLGIDDDLVTAIRQVQPFTENGRTARSLALVQEANRIDKHRYRMAVAMTLSERAQPEMVEVREIDPIQGAQRIIPLNAGTPISIDGVSIELPIASVIVDPPEARVELHATGQFRLSFDVEFGQMFRFTALDLRAATDDVESTCNNLWARRRG